MSTRLTPDPHGSLSMNRALMAAGLVDFDLELIESTLDGNSPPPDGGER